MMKKKAQPKGCRQIGFRKKAQIATTITWAVAFTIILFLMIIFLVVTITLSGKSKNEIKFKEGGEDLDAQRDLIGILNSPVNVDESKNVKELIKLGYEDKEKYEGVLKSEMKNVLDDFEYDYIDFQTKNLRVRGYRIFAKDLFDVESKNFNSGKCIGIPCQNLAGVYVPVSDSVMVYVVIQGSQGAKNE